MAEGYKQFTNKTISIKLDDTHYLQWIQQVEITKARSKLEEYLDGTISYEITPRMRSTHGARTNHKILFNKWNTLVVHY